MADSPIYKVAFRRRKEKKTDYAKRLALVKSGKLRLVVRKSNSNTYAQLVEFVPEGDKTLFTVSGLEVAKMGWKGALGNLPTAYLVGYLLARKAGDAEAILDIGMQRPAKGGRLFAVLKGAVDGGLKIPCDESAFPSEDRLEGKHTGTAPSTFSQYTKRGLEPTQVPDNFKQIKEKISKIGGGK
jgi:large subunit ribosomal protein L18